MFKKRLLAALLTAAFLFGNATIVHAQVIYLFAGGDIQDSYIGKAAKEDIKKFVGIFSLFKPDKQIVCYNQTQLWKGPDIYYSNNVKEAILTAIQNCPAKPSDKIIFYWSGHGAYDQKGHFLFMPKDKGPRALYRTEILDALKAKGASLTVLITDACHVYYDKPVTAPAFAPGVDDYEEKIEGIPPLFRSLFFNCNGVVDINSSHRDEISYCTFSGSFFTDNFVKCTSLKLNRRISWKEFLDAVQRSMNYESNSLYEDYRIKIKQTICFWGGLPSLPRFTQTYWRIVKQEKKFDERPPFEPIFLPLYYPQTGDRIISVDDTKIQNADHFNQVIRDADNSVMFMLIDHLTGKSMNMATFLNPPGSNNRLGINIQDDPDGGVKITGVTPGMPGERCYIITKKFLYEEFEPMGFEDQPQSSEFCPEYGDRIIYVNNIKIRNSAHFNQIIRDADTQVKLTLIDHRTARPVNITTNLDPPGSDNRLGINIQNDNLGGVMVTEVISGTPGEKCLRLDDDNIPMDDEDSSSSSYICPEYGDRIISVNNIKIRNIAQFSQVIRNADTHITFKLINSQTGKTINLTTDLNPKGSSTRLGITVVNDTRGGVMVTKVRSGSPGENCLKLDDDSISTEDEDLYSTSYTYPEYGDRIISVNNIQIRDTAHFSQVINDADTRITFELLDRRTGKTMTLMTDLNPKGSFTRLGITVVNDTRGGVMVTRVRAGAPGTRCRRLINDSVNSVHPGR